MPYTIGLAYGGVYGTGSAGYSYRLITSNNGAYYTYNQYTLAGVFIQTINGPVYPPPGATSYNSATGRYSSGTTTYAYGEMIGVAHGDSIAYKMRVPNDLSKIWNAGNTDYSATGTGSAQSISVNASIVPDQSSSSYPSPDMYMNTVTATINF